MYAVIKLGGFQYKVGKGEKIFTPKLDAQPGDKIKADEILLISNGKESTVGTPTILNASVEGKVLSHKRGRKIEVFKMKRRKNYRRKRGHRQDLTEVLIEEIKKRG